METIQEFIRQRHQAIRQSQLEIEKLETLKSLDCSLFYRKVLKLLVVAKKEEQKRIASENDCMVIIFEKDTSKSLSSLNLFYIGSLAAMKCIDDAYQIKQEMSHNKTPMLFEIASLYIDFFTSLKQTQRAEDIKFIQTQKVPLLPLLLEALIEVSREQFESYVMTQQDKFVKMRTQLKEKPQSKENEEQYPKNKLKSKQQQQIKISNSSQVELFSQLKYSETVLRQSFHRIKRRKDTNNLTNALVPALEDKEKQQFQPNKTFYQNNQKLNVTQRMKRAFSQTELQGSQIAGAAKSIELQGDKLKNTLQRWQLHLLNSVQDVLDLQIVNQNSDMINIYFQNHSNEQLHETNIQNLVSYMISRNNEIKVSIETYFQLRLTARLSNKRQTSGKQNLKTQQTFQENKKNVSYLKSILLVRPRTAFQSEKNEKLFYNSSNQRRWNSINSRKGLSRNNSIQLIENDSFSFYQGEISNGDISKTNKTKGELSNIPIKILKGTIEEESQNQAKVSQEKFIQRMRSTNKIHYLCNNKNRSRTFQGSQDNHYSFSSFSDLHFPLNSKNTSNFQTYLKSPAKVLVQPTCIPPQKEIKKEEGFITQFEDTPSTFTDNTTNSIQANIPKSNQIQMSQKQIISQDKQLFHHKYIIKNPLFYQGSSKKRSITQVGESTIPLRTSFYKAKTNNYEIAATHMNSKNIKIQILDSMKEKKSQKSQILAKVECFASRLRGIEKEQETIDSQRQWHTASLVHQNNNPSQSRGQSIVTGISELFNTFNNMEKFNNKKEKSMQFSKKN